MLHCLVFIVIVWPMVCVYPLFLPLISIGKNGKMKKIAYLLLLIVLFGTACSKEETPVTPDSPAVNNYLLSATPMGIVQKDVVRLALSVFPEYAQYASLPNTNANLIRVTYLTEYPAGTEVAASGVLIVPDSYNADFPTVVYTHGTVTPPEAPSLSIASPQSYTLEVLLCAALSSAFNCAVLMPDYIGYGESADIVHPFIHAESLAQASIDLIRACKEYMRDTEKQLVFNSRLFLTGYSEGGSAAVALHRLIQETAARDFQIEKTIAGSGAYDNVALATTFLSKDQALNPQYVSSYLWAFNMYKADFGYSKPYASIFSDADNTLLQAQGYAFGYFATAKLPLHTNPVELFRPSFRQGVLDGADTEFIGILEANSLVRFVPADSLIFVCGSADDWVYPVNTYNAYQTMAAKGCKVKMYDHPGGTHSSTMPYYLAILLERMILASR